MTTAQKFRGAISEIRVLPSFMYERRCPEPSEWESDYELSVYDRDENSTRSIDSEDR